VKRWAAMAAPEAPGAQLGGGGEERPPRVHAVLDAFVDERGLEHDRHQHQPVHVERAPRADVREQVGFAAAHRDPEVDGLGTEHRHHPGQGQRERIGHSIHPPRVGRGRPAICHGRRGHRTSLGCEVRSHRERAGACDRQAAHARAQQTVLEPDPGAWGSPPDGRTVANVARSSSAHATLSTWGRRRCRAWYHQNGSRRESTSEHHVRAIGPAAHELQGEDRCNS
jgi:hypothetical protein